MKKLFIILAIAAVAFSSCDKKKNSSIKLKSDIDSVSYCIGVSFGTQLKDADLPDFNTEIFKKAVEETMAGKEAKMDQQQIGMFMQAYFSKMQAQKSEKNLKEGQDFLAKNKEKAGVITTASGLQYEVITEGTGAVPTIDDMVSVHYKGSLIDGEVFDSSYDRNQPISFAVSGVIPGWTEALQLMKVGSKYKVYIPSELGYGANPNPRSKIKPNSVLIFEMELLGIEPKAGASKK